MGKERINCNFANMRGLTLLLILLGAFTSYAQDQLVTVKGDTLTGKIDILFPEDLYEEILFENDSEKKRMKAFEFQSLTVDGENYRTIKLRDKYRIMKLEKEGYLSLYLFRVDNNYAFSGLYAYRVDGSGIEVPNMMFKKTMSKFLDGCNSVNLALEEGKFKRKDIEQLVDAYNDCIELNTTEQFAGRQAIMNSNVDTEILTQANAVLKDAQEMGDSDLVSMLNDVIRKLQTGDEVPSYLKKAIEDHVTESHALHQQVTGLLSII